jgi:ABC-type amino acid transport substrate-binding protein
MSFINQLFAAAATAALLLSGCATSPSRQSDPNAPPPLRVGVSGGNAPLIYEAGRGNFDGVEASFAKMLGQELGRPVEFVPMSFEKLIPAVQRGDVDILMSGLTVIDQRKTLVDFASPYMVSGQALLAPTSSGSFFDDPQILFLSPFRIGVERGSVGNLLAQRTNPASTVVTYSTPAKAASALSAGKVDVVLHDAPVLWYIAAQNPTAGYRVVPKLLDKENLAWAVRRGDTALLKQANAALSKWRSNGTLDRTLRTYMPRYDIMRDL